MVLKTRLAGLNENWTIVWSSNKLETSNNLVKFRNQTGPNSNSLTVLAFKTMIPSFFKSYHDF